MNSAKKVALMGMVILSCKAFGADKFMTAAQCNSAHNCLLRGTFEMDSDGHAFIGRLTLKDGQCVNVSLPEAESQSLLGHPPKYRKFSGEVWPYPHGDDVLSFLANGRKVGYGKCGDFFVFVRKGAEKKSH